MSIGDKTHLMVSVCQKSERVTWKTKLGRKLTKDEQVLPQAKKRLAIANKLIILSRQDSVWWHYSDYAYLA